MCTTASFTGGIDRLTVAPVCPALLPSLPPSDPSNVFHQDLDLGTDHLAAPQPPTIQLVPDASHPVAGQIRPVSPIQSTTLSLNTVFRAAGVGKLLTGLWDVEFIFLPTLLFPHSSTGFTVHGDLFRVETVVCPPDGCVT